MIAHRIAHQVSYAEFLPAASRPPHDPKRLPLNPDVGWRIAHADNIVTDVCGHLQLDTKPELSRLLTEANGTLGGVLLPKQLAFTSSYGLLLLDQTNALLKKFDPCQCKFVTVPCTGGVGSGVRQFNHPGAIEICGDNLLVADTDNHRLVVYSLLGFIVRATWQAPEPSQQPELSQLWQPVDIAISQDRKVLVADPANGCIHIFNFGGCWLRCISGVGAVESIAIDQDNQLYVVAGEGVPVAVYDINSGERLLQLQDATDLTQIQPAFPSSNYASSTYETTASGLINLGALCAQYTVGHCEDTKPRWFSFVGPQSGQKVSEPKPSLQKYQQQGLFYSEAMDSRLYRCQWHRIQFKAVVPSGTRIKISTFTAESELTQKQIQNLSQDQWLTKQTLYPPEKNSDQALDWDCLIRSAPGRLLWLKIEFVGDGIVSPMICDLELDFPRISLRRYLPAVFGEEANAADFTDRFLSVFDRGFRQLKTTVDTMAHLFDPLSAPAAAGKSDFLSWLASWIGITLDRQLPLSIRRNLVKHAGKLFHCRGTVKGLRSMLDLYLGFGNKACDSQASSCGPCTTKEPYQWRPPQLILEHYKLRRWLFVGSGRLGDQARLWGKRIVNRTQLGGGQEDGNAQLGVTQLNTRQDPLRDPFHEYAHKFTVFLPGWIGRINHFKQSVSRLIHAEKPAHTQHNIVYVEPRFRVGIQSMIGFDSVIACYPQGITLGDMSLGKGTVLGEQENTDSTIRIGSKSTIGSTTRLR